MECAIPKYFSDAKSVPIKQLLLFLSPPTPLCLASNTQHPVYHRWVHLFLVFHINGIIKSVTFYIWVLNMFWTCVYVTFVIAFILMSEYHSLTCLYHILFVQSSVDKHLSYLYLSAVVRGVDMNILCTYLSTSFQLCFIQPSLSLIGCQ